MAYTVLRRLGLLLLVLGGRLGAEAAALPFRTRPCNFVHDQWKTDDGIPQNSVTGLFQARDGYLWLSTYDGLARFDGLRFKVIHPGNTPGLASSRFNFFHEDSSGDLWIGTETGGLVRYRKGLFQSFRPQGGGSNQYTPLGGRDGKQWVAAPKGLELFQDGRFFSLQESQGFSQGSPERGNTCVDPEGRVWMGTDRGLLRIDLEGHRVMFTTQEGLPANRITALAPDPAGGLWIGTSRGLAHLQNGICSIPPDPGGKITAPVAGLVPDRTGDLWLITANRELLCYRNGTSQSITNPAGPLRGPVVWVREAGDGALWIVSKEKLYRLKGGILSYSKDEKELADLNITSVLADREGSLWVATALNGLHRFKPSPLSVLGTRDGLPREEIYPIYAAKDRSIWIGSAFLAGVAQVKDGKLRVPTLGNGLPGFNTGVTSFCEDREANLWMGTSAGLLKYREGQVAAFPKIDGKSIGVVRSLYEDRSGKLWIGTLGNGLHCLQGGRLTTFTTRDGLVNDSIRTIFEDRGGTLWLATDGGISAFKDGRFRNYTTRDGLSHDSVRPIYQDPNGSLWFGTYGNGLSRLKHGRFKAITTADGLFHHTVSQILEDDRGRMWMTSNRGIFYVPRQELDDFADGRLPSIHCVSFGKADGMKDPECNGGIQPAGCRAQDGKLWIPTAKGVVIIDPNLIEPNELPPLVAIEEASIDGKPADLHHPIVAPPGKGDLEFRFTGLSFLNSARVRFRYRLEGYERDWIETGTRRSAFYTNLPPGHYVFRVLACNSDHVWNETGATLPFRLRPHYYQTYWFYSLCLLALVGMTAAGFRLRIAQLKARGRQLEHLVQLRTHELEENQEKLLISEKMASLGRLTAGIAHEMNTPLAAARTTFFELRKLIGEYRDSAACPEVTASDHREIASEMLRFAELGDTAVARAADFIRSVKSQTRSMSDKEKRWFEGVHVIEESLLLLGATLRNVNARIRFDHPEEVMFFGTPGKLAQVLTNLVVNAAEASEGRNAPEIRILLRSEKNSVLLEVSDTGCGIPPEILTRIFDPMFTTKPFGQSTGLGLSIVHDIVTAEFGGRIEVASRPGEGTTFTIRFEINPPPASAA